VGEHDNQIAQPLAGWWQRPGEEPGIARVGSRLVPVRPTPALAPQRREKRTAATSPNTTAITAVHARDSPTS
jgi:hypothetical protein